MKIVLNLKKCVAQNGFSQCAPYLAEATPRDLIVIAYQNPTPVSFPKGDDKLKRRFKKNVRLNSIGQKSVTCELRRPMCPI
jgi:hypothetical protein